MTVTGRSCTGKLQVMVLVERKEEKDKKYEVWVSDIRKNNYAG